MSNKPESNASSFKIRTGSDENGNEMPLSLSVSAGPRTAAKEQVLTRIGGAFEEEFRAATSAREMIIAVENHKDQITPPEYDALVKYIQLVGFL